MGDYKDWITFQAGSGGLPANVFGYIAMLLSSLMTRHDLRDPKTIPGTQHSSAGKYLSEETLPKRTPPAGVTNKWCVPQRQVENAPAEMQTAIVELTDSFATEHNLTKGKAFDSLDAYCLNGKELFHRHPKDYTHHIVFHPSDAKLVLVQEWGELFGLAGRVGQDLGCVLVFWPRNMEEIKVLEKMFLAALENAKAGKAS
jgi:hypothetical protein